MSDPDPTRPGRVTLVGAGPGSADLITIRGARALAAAEVVVYDRLADPGLLHLAPATAQRIPVGKAKGVGVAQDEINDLLVHHAARGAQVVRLKGGDPFLFGRGGEEIDALSSAGIEVEVVPGVSSATGAPALAGVPLTHRGESASVIVLTGHHADSCDPSDSGQHNWHAIAHSAETVVVLMAATTARTIAGHLLRAGRPADQPVAAIHNAGGTDQQVTVLTLAELAAHGCPFAAPTTLVIGNVARRASNIAPIVGRRDDVAATQHTRTQVSVS